MRDEYWVQEHKTVSAIKSHYFAPPAQYAMRDIPCVSGFTVNGSYVVGANFWGTLAGVFTGSGYSRKNVMSEVGLWRWGPEAIIHEYIHHLDDMGRDGGHEFINLEEFADAYVKMATDTRWAGMVGYAEEKASSTITDTFGLGVMSEHIAYVGARIAMQRSGPDYMWGVFRKVLKKP